MKIKGAFIESGLSKKILQMTLVSLFCILLSGLISLLITKGDFTSIGAIKLTQFLQSIGLFILPPLLVAYMWSNNAYSWLKINTLPELKSVLFALVIMFSAIPAINLLSELNMNIHLPSSLNWLEEYFVVLEKRAEELTLRILETNSFAGLMINIGLVAIIPAFGEELFFRGTIQRLLQEKWKTHVAVWVTAIIFSAFHFQFFGFIPRMLIGALLGYMFVWTQNLWVPIIAHFINNATAVVFYYFKGKDAIVVDIDNIGKSDTIYMGLISIVVVAVLIYLFRRYAKKAL
ncbi:hypothetical protein MASR2M117_21820 [Paludibacter sp.]